MPRAQTQSPRDAEERDPGEIVVFTGDLVGSSKLSATEVADAIRALELASYDLARVLGDSDTLFTEFRGDRARGSPDFSPEWKPRFSSFRGDGWQCLGPAPLYALRSALFFRARLGTYGRQFDTRVSIGIGSGSLPDEPDLVGAVGPAFEISGRGLDSMAHAPRFAVGWEAPPETAPLLQAIFALADEVSRNWTPGQARVFARLLLDRQRPSQAALARELDITQQTVAAHLAGGGDWALQEALKAVEGAG